jgi:hypothetical protein
MGIFQDFRDNANFKGGACTRLTRIVAHVTGGKHHDGVVALSRAFP